MWLLVFIFVAITFVIGWTLFGYFLFMYVSGAFKKKKPLVMPEEWPFISVIIPCYNEESDIVEKITNMTALDYPEERMEILIADGGSIDSTLSLIDKHVGGNALFKVLPCPRKGKIQQLNHALPLAKGDIIVNTDVDARLNKDAFKWLAAEFHADPDAAVVGAYCSPEGALEVESYYWSAQNKGRFIETDANSSSIVIAQCYGFRRALFTSFPDDVVADDIYVAFLAGVLGRKTIYSRKALATEARAPQSYAEFMPHKFRKSNAFLRESLRFIYRLPEMNAFFKITFLTRLAQQLLLPWAFLSWLLIAGVLLTLFRYDIVLFGVGFLSILFITTSALFSSVKLPDKPHRYSIVTIIEGYILTNVIMLSTALSYPFIRQGSDYERLRGDKPKTEKP